MRMLISTGIAVAVLGCGGAGGAGDGGEGAGSDAGGAVSGAPQVSAQYQDAINDAWAEAVKGEYPGNTCAALAGRTLRVFRGQDEAAKTEARQATVACGVTTGARYYLSYLDKVAEGEHTCQDFIFESAKIGALIMSIGEEDMAQQQDRRDRLVQAIAPRVEEVCPGMSRVL